MRHISDAPKNEIVSDFTSLREHALQILSENLEEVRTQHPLDIPRIFEYDRPTLGGKVPIGLFRTVRLLAFREVLGSKIAAAVLSITGRSVAEKMGIDSIPELMRRLDDLAVGRAEIESQSDSSITIMVTECVTCSGAPNIGEPLCHFEGGFIAGALERVYGKPTRVVETKCWGMGDTFCRWETRRNGKAASNGDALEAIVELAGKAAHAMENGGAVRQKNRELRHAYEKISESERLKKDLTDMVVHDMRVPIHAVMGSLETLSDLAQSKLNSKETRLLEMARSSGQTLVQMIDDLMDISRLEEQKISLKRTVLPVSELLYSAVTQIGLLIKSKKLTLGIEFDDDLPDVSIDKGRVVRVLVNLLNNSIQHTSPEGTIKLEAVNSPDRSVVYISVSDTGEGIPKEFHGKIFEKFVQVQTSRARKPSSIGLGLTFCKLVIESHGGRIWVESEPGAGCKFTFSLPVY